MRETGLRVVFLSVLLTLAVSGAAWAHVEVSPSRVPAGATQAFTVEVPTEKEVPTIEVRLELPEGFEAVGAGAPAGWRAEVRGNALVWSGGEIPVANSERFAFEATVPREAGSFALQAIQTYEDGSVVEWAGAADSEEPAPAVEVVSGAEAGGETDEPHHGGMDGSHPEDEHLSETGGLSPIFLLAGALALAACATASATALARGAGRW